MKSCLKFGTTVILAMAMLVSISGCDKFEKSAYRSIKTMAQTYDTSFTILGDLYREGVITDDEKDQAIDAGDKFRASLNVVIDALTIYKIAKTDESRSAVEIAIVEAMARLSVITDLIAAFSGKE